ncbi:caspase-8-like [Polymixia lowei]
MNKGEDTCQAFQNLLQTDDVDDTFPKLKNIQWDNTASSSNLLPAGAGHTSRKHAFSSVFNEDLPVQESKREKKDDVYQLTSKPTGLCVIINNENFEDGRKRNGTNKDAASFAEVFSWLGFRVVMCKDQTSTQMDQLLKLFASLRDFPQLQQSNVMEWSGSEFTELKEVPEHGDAFVCCVLSHGDKGSVSGTDSNLLSINKMTSAFNGSSCPVLISKPKVFFIQACQGKEKQQGKLVECSAPQLDCDESPDPIVYIPVEADFLVATSTVEDYVSYRDSVNGSWFIQSLCQQLKEGCPRGDDLMVILYRVNNEVSKKEGSLRRPGGVKQMPEARKVTLRKRLVFSPCSSLG